MRTEPDVTPLFRFFDPLADYGVAERNLPHWMQAKAVCFITWRTWDSMPEQVVKKWQNDRTSWFMRHNVELRSTNLQSLVQKLPIEQQREYHQLFSARWEAYLDDCHGSCPLRQPQVGKIVADSLRHFDGVRYYLTDFVVMPNHVHVLVEFGDANQMLKQCESWKHFTATESNRGLGRKGRFWEPESFDHLVRSEEQWHYLRSYVAENPLRARLHDGEFVHYSRAI